MNTLILFVAEYLIFVPVTIVGALVAWLAYYQRDWRTVAFVIIGGLISVALAKLSGQFISHPQPFVTGGFEPIVPHEVDNSFPSDHTLLAAFLAFAAIKIKPTIGWPLLVLAVLIGLGRIGAGLHYVTDVLASIGFALIGTLLGYWVVSKIHDKKRDVASRAKT